MHGVRTQSGPIKTKSQLKKLAKEDPLSIVLENTSMMSNEFDGMARNLPEGQRVYIVGPDPYYNRKWYASMERKGDTLKVS